jgi:septal ring factor EnvC (AmiA/AmiB activator)
VKRRLRAALLAALACALLAATPAIAENKSDLEAMRQRISALKKDIEAAESSQHEAADALRASETAISDSKRELRALESRRAQLLARLDSLRAEQRGLEAAIASHGRHIEQMLRQQYMFGQADALKLLLNGEDPNTLARHAGYYGYLSRARADLIGKARRDIARLAELLREREVERGKLDEVRAVELKEQQALTSQRAERRTTLSTLETRIARQRKEYTVLKRDEQRLSELVSRLARLPRKPEPKPVAPKPGGKPETNESLPDASLLGRAFARLKGQLALPVRGEILHRYGSSREDSGVSWKGVFIRAPQGSGVHAVAAGEVVFADWLRGFGNLVIVDHGGDYLSLYSHNESLYKQVGERVKPGDVIASVGASGGNPETGLYFELRHRGRPFDPMSWTRRK